LVDTDVDKTSQQGVCILPRGSEEGEEIILADHQFALRLGVPVRFNLASMTGDKDFKPGDMVTIDEQFHALPPLAVALGHQHVQESPLTEVIVQLAVTQTEVGTLKIQCVAVVDKTQRWDVEFQIRKKAANLLSVKPPVFRLKNGN